MRTLILALVLIASGAHAADTCRAQSGKTTQPLVELYTSEGCSSCPAADRWLSQRFSSDDANYLAFHVDYWDEIGWPDRFASPTYSQRQRSRVGAIGGHTVYTPQVMLGESVNAPWSRERAWQDALQRQRRPAQAALALRLQRHGGNWVAALGVVPLDQGMSTAQVWMALHSDGQITTVRAGENRGRTLRHDRAVRQLWGPWPLSRSALSQRIEVPAQHGIWGLTLFAQDARGRILQSLVLDGSACSP